jgi:hypothetical protein
LRPPLKYVREKGEEEEEEVMIKAWEGAVSLLTASHSGSGKTAHLSSNLTNHGAFAKLARQKQPDKIRVRIYSLRIV